MELCIDFLLFLITIIIIIIIEKKMNIQILTVQILNKYETKKGGLKIVL